MIRNHRFDGVLLVCLLALAALALPGALAQNDTGPDVDVDIGDGNGEEESRESSGWWASGPFLLVVGILFVVAIALIVALAGRR